MSTREGRNRVGLNTPKYQKMIQRAGYWDEYLGRSTEDTGPQPLQSPLLSPPMAAPGEPITEFNPAVEAKGLDTWHSVIPEGVNYYGQIRKTNAMKRAEYRMLGYTPSIWQTPQAVARYHTQLQSGTPQPEWLEAMRPQIEGAFKYFEYRNGDKPWTEWGYLPPEDPANNFLRTLPTPPSLGITGNLAKRYTDPESVKTGQTAWSQLAPDVRAEILADPSFYKGGINEYPMWAQQEILADPSFDWEQLPGWQRTYFGVSSRPAVMGAVQGGLMGMMGGIPGMIGGAVVGSVLGYAAVKKGYDPTKEFNEQETATAKAFGFMNWFAEQAEKALGVGMQAIGATFDPNTDIQDVFTKEGWEAGSLFFEELGPAVLDVPRMYTEAYRLTQEEGLDFNDAAARVIIDRADGPLQTVLGSSELLPTGRGNIFEALNQAREDIANGVPYRDAMMNAQNGVEAQMFDMLGQAIADPLNVLPRASSKATSKIAKLTGHETASRAFGLASGPIEGIKTYSSMVRKGDVSPGFKYNEMSGLAQFAAGIRIDEQGKPQLLSNKYTGQGLLEKPRSGFLNYVTSLDPMSRARAGLNYAHNHIFQLMNLFDTPDDAVSFWNSIKNGDMEVAREIGARFAESPEWYTILPALKEFDMDTMLSVWEASRPNADLVSRIATLLGDTPYNIIDDIATPEKAAQMFERIKNALNQSDDATARAILQDIAAGNFTVDDLVSAGKIFNGKTAAPFDMPHWKALVAGEMANHFSDWAKDFFGLEPDSAFFRAAQVMKKAQSLLLLGVNPNYAINNGINNIASRIATGNFGYMTPTQIDNFITRLGVEPYRLREGYAPAGDFTSPKTMAEGKLLRAKQATGLIADTGRVISNISDKIGIFQKLSAKIEQVESTNAFVMGIKKYMNYSWRRGKGFRRMDPSLENAINARYPGGADIIYQGIEAGLSQVEVENAILKGERQLRSRSFVGTVAREMGIDDAMATSMLDEIGVLDQLDGLMEGVTNLDQMDGVFDYVVNKAQDWIDTRIAQDFANRVEHVRNRIQTEGWSALVDTYIDTELKVQERWLEHFIAFGDAFARLDDITDPVLAGNILESTYRQQAREWRRLNSLELSSYKGIAEALGLGDEPNARQFLAEKVAIYNLWDEVYTFRLDETAKHTDKYRDNWNSQRRFDDFSSLQDRIDQKFQQTFKKVQRLEKSMGRTFADQFKGYGPEVQKQARLFWKEIMDFRENMWKVQQEHRASLRNMTLAERKAANAAFWGETYPALIREFEALKINGAVELERQIKGKKGGPPDEGQLPLFPEQPDEPPPGQPPAGARPEGPDPYIDDARHMDAIHEVASANGITNDVHALNAYRFYGGDEAKSILNLLDVEPEEFARVMAVRDRVKNPPGQIPMPEHLMDSPWDAEVEARLDDTRNAKAALDEGRIEEAKFASDQLEEPGKKATEEVQKAAEAFPHKDVYDLVGNNHIADLPQDIRDAVMYKAADLYEIINIGEPGRRWFVDGKFSHATHSSYPEWYGPLRRSKKDVLNALDAMKRGLDKPETKMYKALKGIIVSDLINDPNVRHSYEWAKALGIEDDVMGNWAWELQRFDTTLSQIDVNDVDSFSKVNDLDFGRLSSLIDSLPDEEVGRVNDLTGENYRDWASRVWDESEAKVNEINQKRAIAEALAKTDKVEKQMKDYANHVMIRSTFQRGLIEVFGLSEAEAHAVMKITDARAELWAKKRGYGATPANWYKYKLAAFESGTTARNFYQRKFRIRGKQVPDFIKSTKDLPNTVNNPLNPNVTTFLTDAGDVAANVEFRDATAFYGEPTVRFDIIVPEHQRGAGNGTAVLKSIMKIADERGVVIRGTAEPIGSGGPSKKQLLAWYKKVGFDIDGDRITYTPQKVLKLGSEMKRIDLYQRAYHGTHAKNIDKFSMKYIGTGEGAQSFSWGLYFTDEVYIGEHYRKQGARRYIEYDGKLYDTKKKDPMGVMLRVVVDNDFQTHLALSDLREMQYWYETSYDIPKDDPKLAHEMKVIEDAIELLDTFEHDKLVFGDQDQRIKVDGELKRSWNFEEGTDERRGYLELLARTGIWNPEKVDVIAKVKAELEQMLPIYADRWMEARRNGEPGILAREDFFNAQAALDFIDNHDLEVLPARKAGQIYEVDLPDGPYLLWDKPLSEQPQAVKDFFKNYKIPGEATWHISRDPNGDLVHTLYIDNQETNTYIVQNGDNDALTFYIRDEERGGTVPHPSFETLSSWKSSMIQEYANTFINDSVLGKDLYRYLAADLQSERLASLKLNEAGVIGNKFLTGDSRRKGEGSYNYVLFDDDAIQIVDTFYQAEDGLPKGGVSFLDDGRAILHAFEGADVSTVVHELGHIFRRDIDGNDLKIIEDWAEVKDGIWTEAAEEKFARGFEKYLANGEAPTIELASVFAKFRRWILEIYQSIVGSPVDVKVTSEVKGVFDRLFVEETKFQFDAEQVKAGAEKIKAGMASDLDAIRAKAAEMRAARTDIKPPLTQEAIDFVNKATSEGAMPAFVTKNLRRIAEENGVKVTGQTKASDILDEFQRRMPHKPQAEDIDVLGGAKRALTEEEISGPKIEVDQKKVQAIKKEMLAGTDLEAIKAKAKQLKAERERIAKEIEARKAQEGGAEPEMLLQRDHRPPGSYDQAAGFMQDGEIMDDAFPKLVQPLLEGMRGEAKRQFQKPQFNIGDLDDTTTRDLSNYMKQVKGDMATTKNGAIGYGESMRDFALLNYNNRTGFDKLADTIFPYQFWYTRTLLNWGMRALDKPAWFANYARMNMQRQRYINNDPERLRNKIRLPAPWMPDFMGGALYIDPFKQMFPFANLLQPFEQMARDNNYQVIEAERILQEWAAEGSMSEQAVREAAQMRSGPVWDKALAEAKLRREAEISNPFDFISAMLGPAWYLSTPAKALGLEVPLINPRGKGKEAIGETPMLTSTRAYETATKGTFAEPIGQLIGLLGKPEEWVRQKAGLPEYGEYGDYYTKRQVANMVADGLISPEQAQQAMIEKRGEIWDQARARVEQELALRIPGAGMLSAGLRGGVGDALQASPSLLWGSGLLPDGELKYRGLYEKWQAALKAADNGDTKAVSEFFDDHPEYSAYLAKGKDDGELLRSFMVGQIWDNYMSLDKPNKRVVRAQLGPVFERSFLNKETRSYDNIDTETLVTWSRLLNGAVPDVEATEAVRSIPEVQFPQLEGIPVQISAGINQYETWREQNYPGIYDIQNIYYGTPKKDRRRILAMFPVLGDYWTDRRGYLSEHPEVAQFVDKDVSDAILAGEIDPIGMDVEQAKRLLMYYRPSDYAVPVRTADYYLQDVSEALSLQVVNYALTGKAIGEGALRELQQIWEAEGRPGDSFRAFLDEIIVPTLIIGK